MTADQEKLIRRLASGENHTVVVALAQVVLELVENHTQLEAELDGVVETLAAPQPMEVNALALATGSATATATAFDNVGSIDIRAEDLQPLTGPGRMVRVPAPSGPITTAELKRRGVDEHLEARSIDVVLRCGWPRHGDPLGIRPCVPVPVGTLERMLDTVATISGVSAVARTRLRETISLLLDEQETIQGLYISTLKTGEELDRMLAAHD